MRTPLAPFFAAEVPDAATAGSALRFVYAALFLAQVGLALVVGLGLVALAPSGARPHDLTAAVLLAMATLHVPLGLLVAWAVSRRPGKGAALVGALTGAIVLSVPAWFAVLLAIMGQRTPYVVAAWALVALGYAGGMSLTPRWIHGATRPPEPEAPSADAETNAGDAAADAAEPTAEMGTEPAAEPAAERAAPTVAPGGL